MASVRASTRVSISWSGGEPFEDTDTLVLTIDGFSLDLRVFNNGPDAGAIDWATVAKVTEVEGSTPGEWMRCTIVLIESRESDITLGPYP